MSEQDVSLTKELILRLRAAANCPEGCLVKIKTLVNQRDGIQSWVLDHNGNKTAVEFYPHLAANEESGRQALWKRLQLDFIDLANHAPTYEEVEPGSLLEGIW